MDFDHWCLQHAGIKINKLSFHHIISATRGPQTKEHLQIKDVKTLPQKQHPQLWNVAFISVQLDITKSPFIELTQDVLYQSPIIIFTHLSTKGCPMAYFSNVSVSPLDNFQYGGFSIMSSLKGSVWYCMKYCWASYQGNQLVDENVV